MINNVRTILFDSRVRCPLLNGETFNDDEAVKSHLVKFFADKDQKFYERGIMKLPERWQKVIEQNGKYIID